MKKNKNNKKDIKFNEKKKNNSKKKFKQEDDEDLEEEEEERYQKKNKGNKRKIQEDNEDEEDDSIDDNGSEIGWNSDDEETYGHLFKSNNNQNDNNEEEEDDDDEEEEGGMLLSDLLTSNTSKNDNNNNNNKQSKKSSKEEEDDNDDDEENDEEDDDEGYDYGESEDDNGNDDNEESDEYEFEREDDDDNDNDDDDNNNNSNHNQLLAAIEKYSKSADTNITTKTKSRKNLLQLTAESPYSSTLQHSDQKVSLDSLINSLQSDTTSQAIDQDTLKFVKNKLSEISKSISAPKYVHKVQSDRAERSITYEQSTTDMTKWQNIIVENKNAKTLDLRQDKRKLPSAKSLIHTYKPQTDMEKEVQMILLNSSQKNELDIEKSEEDELLQNKELSLQEIREKQAELAKVRSLLFYEQMKRHRINKIKSKTFHRILKKKREKKQINKKEYDEMVKKLKANGDIFDDDDDNDGIENGDNNNGKETEEEMMRRIKERMNLRHKNTGKWARMALEHGKGSKSLRDAYHEAVLLGNELTKKANQINEEVVDPYENSIRRPKVDDNDNRSSKKLKIIDETAESLEGVLDSNQNVQNIDGKYKALFEMDFMKKAREQQQLKAKEEAQKLLREIEEMEEGLDSDSDGDGDNNNNSKKSKDHNNKSKEEIQKHKEKLDLARKQMSSLMKGNKSMNLGDQIESNSITTTTTVVPIKAIEDNPWLDASHHNKSRDLNIIIGGSNDNKKQKQKNSVIKEQKNSSVIIKTETENKNNIDNKNSNKNNKLKNKNENSLNTSTSINTTTKVEVKTETKSEPTRKPLLMQKSQQDLVNLAFAGPDLEAEFEALKEKTIDEELNISDKKRKILSEDKAGWGDWAGPGMTGVSKKTVQKRQRLLRNLEEKKAELKLGRTDSTLANVIVSEKRVKTSAKYKLTEVPHPFKTREEYERSIQMPVGNEWNAEHIVRKNTKPEILLRAGRIIEPIKLPKQNKGVEKSKK